MAHYCAVEPVVRYRCTATPGKEQECAFYCKPGVVYPQYFTVAGETHWVGAPRVCGFVKLTHVAMDTEWDRWCTSPAAQRAAQEHTNG